MRYKKIISTMLVAAMLIGSSESFIVKATETVKEVGLNFTNNNEELVNIPDYGLRKSINEALGNVVSSKKY